LGFEAAVGLVFATDTKWKNWEELRVPYFCGSSRFNPTASFRSMSNSHDFQFFFRHKHIRGFFNTYRNERATKADLIPFLQVVSRHFGMSCFRGLAILAPADAVAVEKSAVPAAQVANADVRRIDVQQAMLARYFPLRNLQKAILAAAHDAHRSVLKVDFPIWTDSIFDVENDFSRHDVSPSMVGSWRAP
jgi:hypothetical protein